MAPTNSFLFTVAVAVLLAVSAKAFIIDDEDVHLDCQHPPCNHSGSGNSGSGSGLIDSDGTGSGSGFGSAVTATNTSRNPSSATPAQLPLPSPPIPGMDSYVTHAARTANPAGTTTPLPQIPSAADLSTITPAASITSTAAVSATISDDEDAHLGCQHPPCNHSGSGNSGSGSGLIDSDGTGSGSGFGMKDINGPPGTRRRRSLHQSSATTMAATSAGTTQLPRHEDHEDDQEDDGPESYKDAGSGNETAAIATTNTVPKKESPSVVTNAAVRPAFNITKIAIIACSVMISLIAVLVFGFFIMRSHSPLKVDSSHDIEAGSQGCRIESCNDGPVYANYEDVDLACSALKQYDGTFFGVEKPVRRYNYCLSDCRRQQVQQLDPLPQANLNSSVDILVNSEPLMPIIEELPSPLTTDITIWD